MITYISLLKSCYYPYHLSWEELNNPELVLQHFIQKWDLQKTRILLKKWQAYSNAHSLFTGAEFHEELKFFLNDLEKLIEAVSVFQFQQEHSENRESVCNDVPGYSRNNGSGDNEA